MNRELQAERGRRFRRLHESGTFLMPNAWNAGSAALFETAGFEAVGTTSAGIAYSLGKADATGALSIEEAMEETARIAGAISIPVNVDAENGYGDSPEAVAECIRRCIDAGAVGAGIEDYTWDPERPLYDRTLAVERIRAAREAVDESDMPFVLTARAECYLYAVPDAFAESVARSNLYREAGADMVFVDGIKTLDDLRAYADDLAELPRMYNGDLTTTQEVASLGYKLMICGSTIWLIYKQVREAFEELKQEGRVNPERFGTRWDVAGLLGLDQIYELERKYGVTEPAAAPTAD